MDIKKLEKLFELKEKGILTEEEYLTEKKLLLSGKNNKYNEIDIKFIVSKYNEIAEYIFVIRNNQFQLYESFIKALKIIGLIWVFFIIFNSTMYLLGVFDIPHKSSIGDEIGDWGYARLIMRLSLLYIPLVFLEYYRREYLRSSK